MKTRVLLFAAIAATTFTFVACGNKQAKTNETAAVEQSGAMEIDSLSRARLSCLSSPKRVE